MLQGQAVVAAVVVVAVVVSVVVVAAGVAAAGVVAAAALGWQQTLHVGSSKPGSAAGRPAGSAAPPQRTLLSEMPDREDKGVTV